MYIVANQLELSNGTRRDRAECLLDAELIMPPPVIQKRGALYIITETETMAAGHPRPGDIDMCRQAQEIALQEYYNFSATATITSALRHALEKANQTIYNANSSVLPPERRGVGITLALIRAGELYTAQMPPTQAYLSQQGQFRSLAAPAEQPTDNSGGPRITAVRTGTDPQATLPMPKARSQALPSLGRFSSIDPILQRFVFEEGDMLVLCSAAFAGALQKDDLEHILSGQDSRSALLNFSEFARTRDILDGYCLTVGVRAEIGGRAHTKKVEETGRHSTPVNRTAGVTAKFSPRGQLPSEPLQADKAAIKPARHEDYVYDDASEFEPAAGQDFYQQPTNATHDFKPVQPAGFEADPLAPLSQNQQSSDPWLHREDDDLNRPPYLRGRKVSKEEQPEDQLNGLKNQHAGAYHFTPQSNEPGRKYTYTDPLEGSDQIYTAATSRYNPVGQNQPPMPTMNPHGGAEDEAQTKKAQWGGRYQQVSQARQAAFNPQPEAPHFNLAQEEPSEKKPGLSRGRKQLILLGIGAALAVAVILLLLSSVASVVNNGTAKAQDLVKAAEQKATTAKQYLASSPGQARSLLTQAQADLDNARKEKPDLPDIKRVQDSVRTSLNTLNLVVVPPDMRVIADLSSQGAGTRLTKGILSPDGNTLYLLDSGQNIIYSAELLGQVKPLLKQGDKASNGASTFGKPVALVSRPDGLMVVDDSNVLWLYNKANSSWTAQALGGTANWASKTIRQVASYEGNLYLIGPGNGQILKYNSGSYNANPDTWLNPNAVVSLDLDNAQGFSIDGTIYVTGKDNKVYQLARPNGKDKGEVIKQFDVASNDRLNPALTSPAVLNAGSLNFPYFFIIDSQKRILQFSKADGSLVQQFQASPTGNEFDTLQDIVIDETNKKLFAVSAQKVYVFNLNDPGRSGQPVQLTPGANPTVVTTPGAGTNVTVINTAPTAKS
ncbi:MAG TPA: hypothetical protein VH186_11585 [Chloroflexia bacterium]|nr:hypothetical protein [Chloroflexia bacterium]